MEELDFFDCSNDAKNWYILHKEKLEKLYGKNRQCRDLKLLNLIIILINDLYKIDKKNFKNFKEAIKIVLEDQEELPLLTDVNKRIVNK